MRWKEDRVLVLLPVSGSAPSLLSQGESKVGGDLWDSIVRVGAGDDTGAADQVGVLLESLFKLGSESSGDGGVSRCVLEEANQGGRV